MLNLLPPEIKTRRRVKSLMYGTVVTCVLVITLLGLTLAGLWTWNYIQQVKVSENQNKLDQLAGERKTKEAIIAQAALVEDRLKSGGTYQEKRQWERIFNDIASATPTDTTLTQIDVTSSTETGKTSLAIAGSSTDRRSIVLFRDKLDSNDKIVGVAIQSLAEGTDGGAKTFTFTLNAEYQDKETK